MTRIRALLVCVLALTGAPFAPANRREGVGVEEWEGARSLPASPLRPAGPSRRHTHRGSILAEVFLIEEHRVLQAILADPTPRLRYR